MRTHGNAMKLRAFGNTGREYAVECGNVLGLGGALYAALCSVGMLAREEKDRTAEFLFSHPVSRLRITAEKALSVLVRIAAMNLMILLLVFLSMTAIGEDAPWKGILLLHLAYFILQLEIAGICFGLSAFLSRGSLGAGLGIAALLYMLNLIANISDSAAFLKYITPFAYCDGADILSGRGLDGVRTGIGIALGSLGVLAAFLYYPRKDIR